MILNFIVSLLFSIFLAIFSLFPQKTLTVGFIDDPKSFLPHEVQNDGESIVSDMLFRKLFKYEDNSLVKDLVEKWSVSEDKTTYNIILKEDIYWQDGKPITSDDIIHSITLRSGLRDELNIEKISQKEVLIRLPAATGVLPSLLTFGLEPAHIKNPSKLNPVGSTSFRVSRLMRERDRLEGVTLQSLEKDKLYPRVIFKFYLNENDLRNGYKLGEISTFTSDSVFNWEGSSSKSITYLGRYFTLLFNTQSEKLSDPIIRNKLTNSLNIPELLENNYYKNSLIAQGPISNSKFTKESFKLDSYDPNITLTSAEQNMIPELTVVLTNNQDGQQLESFLRKYWEEKLGIKLLIKYENIEDIVELGKKGENEVLFVGHEVTPDPDRYSFWHSQQIKTGLNFSNFEDLRADKSLEEGRNSILEEDKFTHYNIFQDVMLTKTPAVFLYHPGTNLYYKQGYEIPLPDIIYNPSDIFQNL